MTAQIERWKEDFRRRLFVRLEKLPEPGPLLGKYVLGFNELQKLFRATVVGTGLNIDEQTSGLRYLTRDGSTHWQQLKYVTAYFGDDELYFMPRRIVQHPEETEDYPGLIGTVLVSLSGRVEFLGAYRLYLFERGPSDLIWLYPKTSEEKWYQKGQFSIVDENVIRAMLEENFLGK